MTSLWFVVPAHGRAELARVCLRQLRRTCDSLTENGVEASAVVIADDENLETARDLGFATVERDNEYLGRKFNDGIELACSQAYNPRPVDYVVPMGSDDWVDWRLFLDLPSPRTMFAFKRISFVREDGRELSTSNVSYEGGCGIRIYPREVVETLGFRPCDEDRKKGCDTSILLNLRHEHSRRYALGEKRWPELLVRHQDSDPLQIVDWKSQNEQLNSYSDVGRWREKNTADPFYVLAEFFPSEALDEMSEHYALVAA